MNSTRNKHGIFCLTILLVFGSLIIYAEAQSGLDLDLESRRVPWSQLSFHAKNLWVEVSTEIQLRHLPASELNAVLPASPKGDPVKPLTSQVNEITIDTIIDPRFRSPVKIYNRIWFNPTDASTLGRIRLRRGEDDFKKMYRFTRQGVFRLQIEPKDRKEAALPPENWTHKNNNFYTYDPARLGCTVITERSLPIYILSASDLSMIGSEVSLCAFGKRQLHHVKLRMEGKNRLKVEYLRKSRGKTVRIAREIEALKISLSAEPMESDLDEVENFSFMGLHRDITVYIDPAEFIPILVTGIISGVGKVELNLRESRLKN